jgi:hypothetical protein
MPNRIVIVENAGNKNDENEQHRPGDERWHQRGFYLSHLDPRTRVCGGRLSPGHDSPMKGSKVAALS